MSTCHTLPEAPYPPCACISQKISRNPTLLTNASSVNSEPWKTVSYAVVFARKVRECRRLEHVSTENNLYRSPFLLHLQS